MKKLTSLICIFLVLSLLPMLPACNKQQEKDSIKILCTLFPQYDWIKNIVGNASGIEVSLLIKNGTDPHSYQPTAADIMAISNCDMLVFIGAESDKWVQEALERANASDISRIALSGLDGMTLHTISSHSHSHDDDEHSNHEHEHSFDEHLWLSLANAKVATAQLAEEICKLDPKNSELYRINATDYIQKLDALNKEYERTSTSTDNNDRFILFADRFPFVYLLSDYGIDYVAAFEGCTTDVDADFDTVLKLIKEADRHNVRYIAVTESSDKALALTVASSAKNDIEILEMNSLQSVTTAQISNGISYLGVMNDNLSLLKKALCVCDQQS